MFGESDSESPRVGSPWDSFISAPAPADVAALEVKTRLNEGLPKLVPEVEYGNVEYKLKLTNPSPERFLRLVTQMKWRLLEGGGQAYYELGIADSGHLVGLPRRDLELSLETLEMMAGEIGASVIIVKEIEVPAALVGTIAVGVPQRTPVPALEISGTTETETSTTEDDDDFLLLGLEGGAETPPNPKPVAYRQTHFADLEADPLTHSDFEIEIASVYKPRPHRARPTPVPQTKYTKRGTAPRPKRLRVEMDPAQRAEEKRAKRDARRDARRRALLVPDDGTTETARQLQELHVGSETVPPHVRLEVVPPYVGLETVCDADADVDGDTVVVDTPEPRLIVEALVVRKLALEEAFLDFGGFALEI